MDRGDLECRPVPSRSCWRPAARIPKPPFPWELSPGQEVAEFERLKRQLVEFWADAFPRDDSAYTSVVVPSLTLPLEQLSRLPGASFLEERLLFLLIRLRNPKARLVYVTSRPIPEIVLEYYLQLLAGVPGGHARSRLTLLCAHDSSSRPLTEKILARPRLIERIRVKIPDRSRAYLTVFNSTPLERRLAVLLGVPLNAADPTLVHLGTRSESRRIFRETGLEQPLGQEDVHELSDAVEALRGLRAQRPDLRRAVVKLNDGFSGEGNAVVELSAGGSRAELRERLRLARLTTADEDAEAFLTRLSHVGGVVEELIEAPGVAHPNVQLRINPRGECFVASTHERVQAGAAGQPCESCFFPAHEPYRRELQAAGLRVARHLAARGVISRLPSISARSRCSITRRAPRRRPALRPPARPAGSRRGAAAARGSRRSLELDRPPRARPRALPQAEPPRKPAGIKRLLRRFQLP